MMMIMMMIIQSITKSDFVILRDLTYSINQLNRLQIDVLIYMCGKLIHLIIITLFKASTNNVLGSWAEIKNVCSVSLKFILDSSYCNDKIQN